MEWKGKQPSRLALGDFTLRFLPLWLWREVAGQSHEAPLSRISGRGEGVRVVFGVGSATFHGNFPLTLSLSP